MDNSDRAYEAPVIEELGSVRELTEAVDISGDLDGADPDFTAFHHSPA